MQLKTTKDIYHHLNSLGLTLNEAEIYVYLLKSGLVLGSHIHKDLNKDKSSTYRALNTLVENNLAYKVGESRNQKFGANPEENLLTIVESKKNKLDETSLHLKNFLKTIQSRSKSKFKKRNITIFEGREGYDLYMQSRLTSNKEKLIREIATTSIVSQYFDSDIQHDQYMQKFIDSRVKKGIYLKGLVAKKDANTIFDVSSNKWLKKVRVVPNTFNIRATLTSWDENLGIFSQDKSEVICVLIKDPLVTSVFNQMFEILWNQSKKLPENTND